MVFDMGFVATRRSIDFGKRASCAITLIYAGARPGVDESKIAASNLHLDLLSTVLAVGADRNKNIDEYSGALQLALSKAPPEGANLLYDSIATLLLANGAKLLG